MGDLRVPEWKVQLIRKRRSREQELNKRNMLSKEEQKTCSLKFHCLPIGDKNGFVMPEQNLRISELKSTKCAKGPYDVRRYNSTDGVNYDTRTDIISVKDSQLNGQENHSLRKQSGVSTYCKGIKGDMDDDNVIYEHIIPRAVKKLWLRQESHEENDLNDVRSRRSSFDSKTGSTVSKSERLDFGNALVSHDVKDMHSSSRELRNSDNKTEPREALSEHQEHPTAAHTWGIKLRHVKTKETKEENKNVVNDNSTLSALNTYRTKGQQTNDISQGSSHLVAPGGSKLSEKQIPKKQIDTQNISKQHGVDKYHSYRVPGSGSTTIGLTKQVESNGKQYTAPKAYKSENSKVSWRRSFPTANHTTVNKDISQKSEQNSSDAVTKLKVDAMVEQSRSVSTDDLTEAKDEDSGFKSVKERRQSFENLLDIKEEKGYHPKSWKPPIFSNIQNSQSKHISGDKDACKNMTKESNTVSTKSSDNYSEVKKSVDKADPATSSSVSSFLKSESIMSSDKHNKDFLASGPGKLINRLNVIENNSQVISTHSFDQQNLLKVNHSYNNTAPANASGVDDNKEFHVKGHELSDINLKRESHSNNSSGFSATNGETFDIVTPLTNHTVENKDSLRVGLYKESVEPKNANFGGAKTVSSHPDTTKENKDTVIKDINGNDSPLVKDIFKSTVGHSSVQNQNTGGKGYSDMMSIGPGVTASKVNHNQEHSSKQSSLTTKEGQISNSSNLNQGTQNATITKKQPRKTGLFVICSGDERDKEFRKETHGKLSSSGSKASTAGQKTPSKAGESVPITNIDEFVTEVSSGTSIDSAKKVMSFTSNSLIKGWEAGNDFAVPEVIYDGPVEDLKSIMRTGNPSNAGRGNNKVSFKTECMVTVHSYPSAESLLAETGKELTGSIPDNNVDKILGLEPISSRTLDELNDRLQQERPEAKDINRLAVQNEKSFLREKMESTEVSLRYVDEGDFFSVTNTVANGAILF